MKRPGRPRIDPDDQSVSVNVRLPARQYDQMYAEAQREHISVAEAVRRRMAKSDDDTDAE